MNVRCEKCKNEFEVPLKTAGKIEYSRCENVFRVAYRFKTSCTKCKSILLLTPHGRENAVGIPVIIEGDEKTQLFEVEVSELEETLPRVAIGESISKMASIAPKKVQPKFIMTHTEDLILRKPMHVSLQSKPKGLATLPLRKIFFVGVILVSTTVTALMTSLALQSAKKTTKSLVPAKVPTASPSVVPPTQKQYSNTEEAMYEGEPESEQPEEKVFYVKNLDKITSKYGKRLDPIDFVPKFHHGLDIAEKNRAEIVAALEGVVDFVGSKGGYGNIVVLRHDDGYETLYGHLAKTMVKKGRRVKQGDLIGLAGSTGRSTGTHLHFELKKDGKPVDPYRVELMSKVTRAS